MGARSRRHGLLRRDLLRLAAGSPIAAACRAFAAPGQGDIDAGHADVWWQAYLNDDEQVPRHPNREAEQALQALSEPILRTSTRKQLDWRVGLVPAAPGNINAFTPGGGVVMVHDALIAVCDTEAELASVIAHEVGHVEHRHAIRRLYAHGVLVSYGIDPTWNQQQVNEHLQNREVELLAQKLVYRSYQRLWEHEADSHILKSFRDLGYPLSESHTFFEKLLTLMGDQDPDYCIFSTHPLTRERITRLKGLSRAYGRTRPRAESEAFRFLKSALG